jgi:hypothetical protein
MQDRKCEICGTDYSPNSSQQRTCFKFECYRKNKTLRHRERAIRLGLLTGLPRGEAVKHNKSVLFTTGITEFRRRGREIKEQKRYCEKCDKDLNGSTQYLWCLHHKDFDRRNNPIDGSNWELLCKSCHNKIHLRQRGKRSGIYE